MNNLLDTIGPAVFRASWQAAALALVIVTLVWCLGERLPPRWRYLLWSVVLVRLLLVVTPASPWSIFNFAPGMPSASAWQTAGAKPDAARAPGPFAFELTFQPSDPQREPAVEEPLVATTGPALPAPEAVVAKVVSPASSTTVGSMPPVSSQESHGLVVARIVSSMWLAGCLVFGLKLLGAARLLRRRLAACRPVTDAAVLELLETACGRIGLRRAPALLVTPESVSPCVAGAWTPRIVLPESVITDSSISRLGHLLAHELAHLARGDLWTNWLLLTARVFHWFNPVVWWTIREMQAEREAACDELALSALGETDRSAYAATIIDLATNLAPSEIAPGMIGLFSSTRRLQNRVERLVRFPAARTLWSPLAASMLLAVALIGLTDALPAFTPDQPTAVLVAQSPKSKSPTTKSPTIKSPTTKSTQAQSQQTQPPNEPTPAAPAYVVRGRCLDHEDSSPLAGMQVRLFKVQGRGSPPVEVARTLCNGEGRFEFAGLVPPHPEDRTDPLIYEVFAISDDRPIGIGGMSYQTDRVLEIRIGRDKQVLSGTVVDAQGRPVAGATVMQDFLRGSPVPGILSATTDADGRFKIDKVAIHKLRDGTILTTHFSIVHPDFPRAEAEVSGVAAEISITLPTGCLVTGTVTDGVTGKPAANAVVTAQRIDTHGEALAVTDAAGRFRMAVLEARYNILVEGQDRVCVALPDREFLVGGKVELPPFQLIAGGIISGRVINTATGQPVAVTEKGEPLMLGLYGPSQTQGWAISPLRLAAVADDGRFVLRAAPGDNFPYFVNIRGVRMAWDTRQQPAVVVKEGETTLYDMLITPEVPPEEKLKAAQQLVDSFSKQPAARTEQILVEFRKLDHTVNECELWCTLMRELVAVGKDAVPQLCAELDRTTKNVMLRRLAFALRAIGDPRAVPALIRAIPKTLLPASSDYGLIVNDKALTTFMQTHDLMGRPRGGTYFDFGRPEREISGALHRLAKQAFTDSELSGFSRSSDPRRQVLQSRVLMRQAQLWQAWWQAHWRELTDDAAYQNVGLATADEPLPPAAKTLGPQARIADGEGMAQAVLSPASEAGQYVWNFFDLDIGHQLPWPAHIPRDEAQIDWKQLTDWAADSGADLMCVTHRAEDGTETYVLRTLGVQAWEIGSRDLRNIERLVAAGTLPEGREAGELLMHFDAQSQQSIPDANGAFLFITREGNRGLIETTDRVTRTQDLTGTPGRAPAGVGFHKGVRFNLKPIIP
jgi:beta-lactamase regulating signal transducer with metallopeptidase domain/5-hydroxyisourate hydrolase-like protein (transthyretin family)